MELAAKKKQNFEFNSFVWHEINHNIWLFDEVEKHIQENFTLNSYTDNLEKIKSLFFAFQINPSPVNEIFSAKSYFAYKKGIIFLYAKIDYELFKNASQKEALQLLCETYLDAILTIPSLRGMKKIAFDAQKLHNNLRVLFLEKGFLE